jgi:hypothetical protein
MAYLSDDFQKFGKEHLEVVTTSSSSLAKSWLAMRNSDTEWQIGETMAEVLRERFVELETLEATGAATEEAVGRLAVVRKLLIRFDASGHAASVSTGRGGVWTQQASKLVGTGAIGSPSNASPSRDRNDNSGTEAARQRGCLSSRWRPCPSSPSARSSRSPLAVLQTRISLRP